MAEKTILKEQITKIGEEEGLTTKADCRVNTPGDLYYNRPADFVIERTMIYSCYRCKDPYYTGLLNDFILLANQMELKTLKTLKMGPTSRPPRRASRPPRWTANLPNPWYPFK